MCICVHGWGSVIQSLLLCMSVHVAEWEQHVSVPASVVSVSLVAPVSQSAVGRTGMTSER